MPGQAGHDNEGSGHDNAGLSTEPKQKARRTSRRAFSADERT